MAVVEPITPGLPIAEAGLRRLQSIRELRLADRIALGFVALVTLLAIFGPMFAPHDPLLASGPPYQEPNHTFPFGTDPVGRDMLSRLLFGIRSTWLSAFAVIASGVIIGGLIGLIAGALGGWVDAVLMRFTDICLALPGSILAIAIVAALGPSLFNTLLAVSMLWWPYYARLVRADIRALASRPHMEAARMAGTSMPRRLARHLFPGAIPVLIVGASLDIANLIILLAGLSFIGLGAPPPAPELGSMTSDGLPDLLSAWWLCVIPGLAVFCLSLLGNVAGDTVRRLVEKP